MPERFLSFDCEGDSLAAVIHEPECGARDVGVLIIVGGPQYRVGSHRQFVLIARDLAAAGYPVLRFDYRGMGDSDGALRTFEHVDDDTLAAINTFCREQPRLRGVVILGLCDGASAALIYSLRLDTRVRGMILANPWVRTAGGSAQAVIRHYYLKRLLQRTFWSRVFAGKVGVAESFRSLVSTLLTAARSTTEPPAADRSSFVDRMAEGLRTFRGPVLLLMSGRDLTAREFDDLCGREQRWSSILSRTDICRADFPAADHTFSSSDSRGDALRRIHAWLSENCDRSHGAQQGTMRRLEQ